MKKAVTLGILGSLAIAWWCCRTGETDRPKPSESLVLDRVWIDHIPTAETEAVQAFVALAEPGVGIFNNSSLWRGSHEAFRFEAHGAQLRIQYPQTGEREVLNTAARSCDKLGMDYCLELRGASRGVQRYYSREGWEVPPGADAAAAVEQRLAALRHPVTQ